MTYVVVAWQPSGNSIANIIPKHKYISISPTFYSILFYSILFYSILFYSILFYSILFYSILFYSEHKTCPRMHQVLQLKKYFRAFFTVSKHRRRMRSDSIVKNNLTRRCWRKANVHLFCRLKRSWLAQRWLAVTITVSLLWPVYHLIPYWLFQHGHMAYSPVMYRSLGELRCPFTALLSCSFLHQWHQLQVSCSFRFI